MKPHVAKSAEYVLAFGSSLFCSLSSKIAIFCCTMSCHTKKCGRISPEVHWCIRCSLAILYDNMQCHLFFRTQDSRTYIHKYKATGWRCSATQDFTEIMRFENFENWSYLAIRSFLYLGPGNQAPTKCISSSKFFGRIHALSHFGRFNRWMWAHNKWFLVTRIDSRDKNWYLVTRMDF